MKFIVLFTLLLVTRSARTQHTFSIVAIDTLTREVGSAGATCLDNVMLNGEEGALVISDIILGIGAIHTQARWNPENQKAARDRMKFGDSPNEIIDFMIRNDFEGDGGTISKRQYGIVSLELHDTRSAAFTGSQNIPYASHRLGPTYSIQGNILLNEEVLNDMELNFLETQGSLAEKLMAAMEGAKRIGSDKRCFAQGVSSLSAFIRVARPTDTDSDYENLSLDINVGATPDGVDPIDVLRRKFDMWLLESKE